MTTKFICGFSVDMKKLTMMDQTMKRWKMNSGLVGECRI
jgi:hypothetical protein